MLAAEPALNQTSCPVALPPLAMLSVPFVPLSFAATTLPAVSIVPVMRSVPRGRACCRHSCFRR